MFVELRFAQHHPNRTHGLTAPVQQAMGYRRLKDNAVSFAESIGIEPQLYNQLSFKDQSKFATFMVRHVGSRHCARSIGDFQEFGAVVWSMDTSNVDSVFVAGKSMKRDGKLLHVNWNAVKKAVTESRDYVLKKSGFKLPPL
jgi:hypothetical protein